MSWPISIRNLTKRFGERTILDRLSMTIAPGETVAIIGPSGGGKSTFIRCINGLAPFDEGEIDVGSVRLSPKSRNRIRGP
jgi:ABC-type multidrug transport system ATPase subunit